MKNKLFGVLGLVMVLFALLATVTMFAFIDGIQKADWIDAEAAVLGAAIICLVGAVLGWVSFRTSAGKLAGILGTMLIALYVFQLFRRSQPCPASPYPSESQSLTRGTQERSVQFERTDPKALDPSVRD